MRIQMNEPFEVDSIDDTGFEMEKVGDAQSIGGGVEKVKEKNTDRIFYRKADKGKEEYEKFHAMFRHQIPGPITTIFEKNKELLYTSGTNGMVFSEYMKTPLGQLETPRIISSIVEEIDNMRVRMSRIDDSITKRNPGHTKHPIDNYRHRFVKKNSSASNVFLNANTTDIKNLELPPEVEKRFQKLHSFILKTIELYEKKIAAIGNDSDGDTEIAFGDAKPENVIIDSLRKELYFVDPSFIRGSRYFDYSKLISRLIMEGIKVEIAIYEVLRRTGDFNIKKDVYRGLSIADLVNIDMVNILSSYLGRALSGNNSYRMVDNLTKNEFIQNLQSGLKPTNFTDIFGRLYS